MYKLSLSSEELRRAETFRAPQQRDAFFASRGALRRLLAHYTDIPAHAIQIALTTLGKPFLQSSTLHFNVAHSGEMLGFIFAQGMNVGIDIEQIQPLEDLFQIADLYFAPSELKALRNASVQQRLDLFFQIWTAKEAFLKAAGQGLSRPPDSFAVDPEFQLLQGQSEGSGWFLHSFSPATGYAGALAWEGHPTRLSWKTLTHD